MVASYGNPVPANNRVVLFHDDAIGDATPVHTIEGEGVGASYTGTPFAVPSDVILEDGFDA